jgi:Alginate lyase
MSKCFKLATAAFCLAASTLALAKDPAADTSNPAYAKTPVDTSSNTTGKPAKPAGFVHPGIIVNQPQLSEIKKRIAAGTQPQKAAFDAIQASPLALIDYTPHPWATVECGSYSNPNLGCKDEEGDAQAAYTQALLWSITGNEAYAKNAIRVMNAWSEKLTGGHTNANAQVQASWAGSIWPRAAEIIRYTYKGWSDADILKFQNMLTTQYLPSLIHGTCENGNKELTMSEAIVNIGVFTDNRTTFNFGITIWRGRAPAYIYLKSDGPKPIEPVGCGPAIWGNKGFTPDLVDGLLQESARDPGHANFALAGMVDVAETARQQGLDLYSEIGSRVMAALEFQAQYLPPSSTPAPPKLEFAVRPTWEIAFNHYHNRLGRPLPKMAAVLPLIRPTGTNHQILRETLTHADTGAIGLPSIKK